MNTPVNFEIAKLLKEKGFDNETLHFYTKPRSKMFGIDEYHRVYPIKNISKKLYTTGCEAALNVESVYFAPTISEVVMWLYEKHWIWVWVKPTINEHRDLMFTYHFTRIDLPKFKQYNGSKHSTLIESYQEAISYMLKNLIK